MIYGRWRRTVPRTQLDPFELRQRDHEEAWDLRNERIADHLDSFIDKTAHLTASVAFSERTYPRGTRFRVIWRTKDRLIVAWLHDTTVLAVIEGSKFELDEPMISPRGKLMDIDFASRVLEDAMLNRAARAASEGR